MMANFLLGLTCFVMVVLVVNGQTWYHVNICTDLHKTMNAVADKGYEGCRRIQDVDGQKMTYGDWTLSVACSRKLAEVVLGKADDTLDVQSVLEYYRITTIAQKTDAVLKEINKCPKSGDTIPANQAEDYAKCAVAALRKVCPPVLQTV